MRVEGRDHSSCVQLVDESFAVEDDEIPLIAVGTHRRDPGAIDSLESAQDALLVAQRRHVKDRDRPRDRGTCHLAGHGAPLRVGTFTRYRGRQPGGSSYARSGTSPPAGARRCERNAAARVIAGEFQKSRMVRDKRSWERNERFTQSWTMV